MKMDFTDYELINWRSVLLDYDSRKWERVCFGA